MIAEHDYVLGIPGQRHRAQRFRLYALSSFVKNDLADLWGAFLPQCFEQCIPTDRNTCSENDISLPDFQCTCFTVKSHILRAEFIEVWVFCTNAAQTLVRLTCCTGLLARILTIPSSMAPKMQSKSLEGICNSGCTGCVCRSRAAAPRQWKVGTFSICTVNSKQSYTLTQLTHALQSAIHRAIRRCAEENYTPTWCILLSKRAHQRCSCSRFTRACWTMDEMQGLRQRVVNSCFLGAIEAPTAEVSCVYSHRRLKGSKCNFSCQKQWLCRAAGAQALIYICQGNMHDLI
mmetsp:Transcript_132991/g.242175  ORF Transcript_132991/g.242175 Transcript_132991/m.242175 type:complete len:289 (-) Transcript_132991:1066-1932(-)